MKKVIFYFDGFNFYNGCKQKTLLDDNWKDYLWIDFVKFCRQFLHEGTHELVMVKYFTAPPLNQEQRSKQSALFSANKILNPLLFFVYQGNHQQKYIECKYCKKMFPVWEEKRTDVSIAVHMLTDCFNDDVDLLILITADSDQIPTIQTIRSRFPGKVLKVYFPPERKSAEILNIAKPVVYLGENESRFRNAVMPPKVMNEEGTKVYTRPERWKK